MKSKNPNRRWSLGSICVLLLVLFPALAFADATSPPPTALQALTDQVLSILIPAFVTAIGTVATWLLIKLKNKLHLDVSDKTMAAWSGLAERAALRGAEWARQKAKELTDGKKLPGGEVMDVAVNWALQMAEQQKLPVMAREKLVGLIEAQLFKLRQQDAIAVAAAAPANGATADMAAIPRI